MSNISVIDKINSLNNLSGYSNNRMAYELSKILKERTMDKTTPQQEESAIKEFRQLFSSRSNSIKNREELANQFRDRFLKKMGIEPSEVKSQIINSPSKVKPDKDRSKIELPKIEEIRKIIPQIIRAILFKGKAQNTSHKSLDILRYNASLQLDGDNKKLNVERKNDKSLALEAIKKGKEEFEIINNFIVKEELEQIRNYLKIQLRENQDVRIKTKNKNNDIEV